MSVLADHPEVKLFGKWSCEDVAVSDMCLQDYIAVKERHAKFLPHSSGRCVAVLAMLATFATLTTHRTFLGKETFHWFHFSNQRCQSTLPPYL